MGTDDENEAEVGDVGLLAPHQMLAGCEAQDGEEEEVVVLVMVGRLGESALCITDDHHDDDDDDDDDDDGCGAGC